MTLSLSPKQIMSFQESNHRINVWQGSVRSGKSFSSILRYIDFVINGPPGDHIIIGRTIQSLKRNVIGPLFDFLGMDMKYYIGKGEINLYGRTIHVIGANDDRASYKIQGATAAGGYVDEATIIPENVFKMLLSRLSVPGAKLFVTTNPDGPFHWFKTEFIDRQDQLDLGTFNFYLDDNPSLTKEFKDNLKREYQGLWYERYIEGKWVLAEGTVYDFFDVEKHVIDIPPGQAQYYIVGVDYGTTNPCVFSLIGYNPKYYPNVWLEKEYVWDSREQLRQKSDLEYAEDLKKFIWGYNVKQIYIDPSAASFKVECMKQGLDYVQDAKNEVLDGIRFQAQLLIAGTYKITACCKTAIKEYQSYCWDPRASSRGEDKPKKEFDHSLDSQRYALFTHFYKLFGEERNASDIERDYKQAMGMDDDFFNTKKGWSPL